MTPCIVIKATAGKRRHAPSSEPSCGRKNLHLAQHGPISTTFGILGGATFLTTRFTADFFVAMFQPPSFIVVLAVRLLLLRTARPWPESRRGGACSVRPGAGLVECGRLRAP